MLTSIKFLYFLKFSTFAYSQLFIPNSNDPENLPDFKPDADYLRSTLSLDTIDATSDPCLIQENCLNGPGLRTVLRFGTK